MNPSLHEDELKILVDAAVSNIERNAISGRSSVPLCGSVLFFDELNCCMAAEHIKGIIVDRTFADRRVAS